MKEEGELRSALTSFHLPLPADAKGFIIKILTSLLRSVLGHHSLRRGPAILPPCPMAPL